MLVLFMSVEFSDRIAAGIAEYYSLILFALSGMLFAASANDFAMLFVSLELITITFYVLTSFQRGAARVARSGREISDPRRAVVGVHGVRHRAGLGHDGQIQFQRAGGGRGAVCRQQDLPVRRAARAGRARLQDRRVSVPNLGAGRLSGRADADDRVSGGRLQGRRLCPAAARSVHRGAGRHGALGESAHRHFRHHDSLRQPVRDSAAQPQAAARLFEHRARGLPAAGRGGAERERAGGGALLSGRLPVHGAGGVHGDLPRDAAAGQRRTFPAWPV